MAANSNNWLRHVKRLAARPGDQPQSTFSLPQHVEDSLGALESSNRICEFFSSISQEYTPLTIETLPDHVRSKLANDPCNHPYLADHIVYDGLKKGKKTCSVPGDIPKKLLREFFLSSQPLLLPYIERLWKPTLSQCLSRRITTCQLIKYLSPDLRMTLETMASPLSP